jgi:hypothetical protein
MNALNSLRSFTLTQKLAKLTGWSQVGGGTNGPVNALAVDSAGNLYVGGNYITAGGVTVTCNFIAKYSTTGDWSALGTGTKGTNGTVNALAFDSADNLYVGGTFTTAGGVTCNNIAKYSTTGDWSALGTGTKGTNGTVKTIAVDSSDNLYAGGEFTTAGGNSCNYIAKYTTTGGWTALSGGGTNNYVLVIAVDSADNLYVGGHFTTAGGVTCNRIAKYSTTGSWSTLGGTNSYVYAIAIDSADNLYVGGQFTTAGGVSYNRIAKYSTTGSWSALGTGTNHIIRAITVDSTDNLYVGGIFTDAGDVTCNYIAKYTTSTTTWSALGRGTASHVYALAVDSTGNLYAGGGFTTAGGVSCKYVAKYIN